MYSTFQYNYEQFNGVSVDDGGAESGGTGGYYQLELHEATGALVWTLPRWYGGRWIEEVNVPSLLSFSYPDDDTGRIEAFSFGREVWLYRENEAAPLDKFLIYTTNLVDAHAVTLTLNCRSLLYQLSMEQVPYYAQSGATAISTVLGDLLNDFQVKDNPLLLGTVDSDIGDVTWSGAFEFQTVLACIHQLHARVGGYFYVDADRYLHWTRTRGDQTGKYDLRLGRNCPIIQKTVSDTDLANRIIAYGAGATEEDRVTVTVDDTDSQTAYGIRTAFFSDKRIKDVTLLQSYAEAELRRRAVPRTAYSVGSVDLSALDSVDYSDDLGLFQIGSIVRVLGSADSAIDFSSRIIKIERTLDNPLAITLGLTDPLTADEEGGSNAVVNALAHNLGDLFGDWFERGLEGDDGTIDEIARRLGYDPGASGADAITVGLHTGFRAGLGLAFAGHQETRDTLLDAINTALDTPDGSGETRRADFDENVGESVSRLLDGAGGSGSVKETLIETIQTEVAIQAAVETVDSLPAIPASGMLEVFWASTSPGDGDDQVWRAYAGQSAWTPTQKSSTLSGIP